MRQFYGESQVFNGVDDVIAQKTVGVQNPYRFKLHDAAFIIHVDQGYEYIRDGLM